LRHRGKKYNRRANKKAGRGCIPNRRDISKRPKEAESKKVFGHFELDTIVGKNHAGAIVSIVDRHTKIAYLRLVERGTAEQVTAAICEALSELAAKSLVRSLTSDNGKEFSSHELITEKTGALVYFATPYHSWERGLNEHTNGLVRQYIPKGTDFANITAQDVARVESIINNRPRKILKYRTPYEAMKQALMREGFS
jgi:IS30 family transposase